MDTNEFICKCIGVTKNDLKQTIIKKGYFDFEEILDETSACIACGTCFNEIRSCIKNILSELEK